MFGRKKSKARKSLEEIGDSLATAKAARSSAQRSAERALKAAERAEQKAVQIAAEERDKADRRAAKFAEAERRAELKSAKKLTAEAKKADKAAAEAAKRVPQDLFDRITDPKSAKRAITAVKVIGPVLAPFILKAATKGREVLDDRRARQLGVDAGEVGAYRGPTGQAEARLAGLRTALDDLRKRKRDDLQATRFAEVSSKRVDDLVAAVRAAATMPAGRRRATIATVTREADRIDADLMDFLVGR